MSSDFFPLLYGYGDREKPREADRGRRASIAALSSAATRETAGEDHAAALL